MRILLRLLYRLVPPSVRLNAKQRFHVPDVRLTFRRLRAAGYEPGTILDVGAHDAQWASDAIDVWGTAQFFLFEPNPEYAEACQRWAGVRHRFYPFALAAEDGKASFLPSGSNSSFGDGAGAISVETRRLDTLLATADIRDNALLKIDVQGFERGVLEGAEKTIEKVEVMILEVSLIRLNPNAMDMKETIDSLDRLGFRPYDIPTFWRRPIDDALWQIDLVFVRKESRYGHRSLGYAKPS